MAARDSRGSRRRLLLFVMSMAVGVAALVAINGFGANLRRAVDEQALGLLGADLGVESDIPFDDSTTVLLDGLAGEKSRRTTFASMAYFPRQAATRIVSVRAVSGGFPFYGDFETRPSGATSVYQESGGALIDPALEAQFGLRVGDTLRVGRVSYPILGVVVKTSSEPAFVSVVSPRVYVPLEGVDETLLSFGSRVDYEVFYRFPAGTDVARIADELDATLSEELEIHTVEREREAWSEALGNLYRFLGLVALTALLLGAIGVASAIHVYIQQRRETVALLRCIGVTPRAATRIYLIQASILGLVGATIGAVAGTALQFLVPGVLSEALPFSIEMRFYALPVLTGLIAGVSITVLFAALPLLSIRDISPLAALRSGVEQTNTTGIRGRARTWSMAAVALLGAMLFGAWQGPTPIFGLGYVVSVAVVLALLAGIARIISMVARRSLSESLPFVMRQGIANLYRPNNQTQLILLAVGFGAFLVLTLLVVRTTLLSQVRLADEGDRPNLIFFDVQPDQRDAVRERLVGQGLPIVEEVPIVAMRIASVKGRDVRTGREGEDSSNWVEDREYRSTYRALMTDTEELIEGEFTGTYRGEGPVPVSVERDIAADLQVTVGDSLTFDVQGRRVETIVGSIRQVDWNRMQTNFFVVFPDSVLENAPQTWVTVSRASDAAQSGRAQAAIVSEFPNVSAIDLTLIIEVLEGLFARLSAVIQFMALFSIVTGLIILAGAVVVSRYRRIDEIVLLKTLGASRADVRRINTAEYLSLGTLSALVALGLALPAGWMLARYVFVVPYEVPVLQLAIAVVAVALLTTAIGILNSRGIYGAPALRVLGQVG